MAEDLEKIVGKLKKLLALAKDQRGNENEASAAMAKVQSLLAEYNMSMQDLENHSNQSESHRIRDDIKKFAMYSYQRELFSSVARSHYCLYWTGSSYSGKNGRKSSYHIVVGREANAVAARLMFEYLNETINRLAGEQYSHKEINSRSAISWKQGCADRLKDRLAERREAADKAQREKASSAQATTYQHPANEKTANAVVLLENVRSTEQDLNTDFISNLAPGTTAARRAINEANYAKLRQKQQNEQAEQAERLKEKIAAMTDKEKAAFFKKIKQDNDRAEASYKRREESYWRKHDQKEARKDHYAYSKGHAAGEMIGLDDQIDHSETLKIG